jgi:hypothetical protein
MVEGHAKTAFLHAAISAAAHRRQRRHGLKKKSTTKIRLRRILENTVRLSKRLSIYREDYTGNSYKGTHESSHARKSILVLFTRVLGILRLFGFPGMMMLFMRSRYRCRSYVFATHPPIDESLFRQLPNVIIGSLKYNMSCIVMNHVQQHSMREQFLIPFYAQHCQTLMCSSYAVKSSYSKLCC